EEEACLVHPFFADYLQNLFFMGLTYYQIALYILESSYH
ncbi:hypothetical protein SAMN04490355_11051, partial [Pelosinus propionicus DSM 13327]